MKCSPYNKVLIPLEIIYQPVCHCSDLLTLKDMSGYPYTIASFLERKSSEKPVHF